MSWLPRRVSVRARAGEGGCGLLLVSEPADKRGVTEREPGRAVWFECVVPAD
ncbi:hypothetical protein ACI3K5_00660 [Streptomyces sp. MPA0124]|uniref:hypothetical protein n=1 Tax=Streptomyces TaxID=1883 RepID=UPI003854C9FB